MPTAARPSGHQVVLVHGDQEVVAVGTGGGLRSYRAGGVEVLDGYAEHELCSGGRGQPLLPWPNRLGDGRYTWRGTTYQLPLSEPATSTAIHGLTRWSTWQVLDAGTATATLGHHLAPQPGYPWALDVRITYDLGPDGLAVSTEVVNRSGAAAPWGLGFHPYLSAGGALVDGCTLAVPAVEAYDTDDRGLPTGRHPVAGTPDDLRAGRPVGDRRLDLPLTSLERDGRGRATVVLETPAGATSLWVDGGFTHLQLFSGDTLAEPARRRRGLAVEPMTGPAGLLASGDGLVVLEPGRPWSATWGVTPPGAAPRPPG